MKRLLTAILLLSCLVAAANPYGTRDIPNVQIGNRYRFTSNPDGILSAETVARLDSICYDLRHRGLAQTAIVAVREIDSDDMFDFAYRLFSEWGVGNKSDNGLGILLVESEHEIRFVTGYGLEGVLPDAICKRIQTQRMLPYFRRGDYDGGMTSGMEAIRSTLEGSELDNGGNDDYVDTHDDDIPTGILLAFGGFLLIYFIAIWLIYRARRRCPECHKTSLRIDSTRTVSRTAGASVYEDTLVCGNCGAVVKRRRRSGNGSGPGTRRGGGGGTIIGGMGGFGGFGGSGGSSIGGGFGGGSFGGGGAGSRW